MGCGASCGRAAKPFHEPANNSVKHAPDEIVSGVSIAAAPLPEPPKSVWRETPHPENEGAPQPSGDGSPQNFDEARPGRSVSRGESGGKEQKQAWRAVRAAQESGKGSEPGRLRRARTPSVAFRGHRRGFKWRLDQTGGALSRGDLGHGLEDTQEDDAISALFRGLDLNQDGQITAEDFVRSGAPGGGQQASTRGYTRRFSNTFFSATASQTTAYDQLANATLDNANQALWEATKKIACGGGDIAAWLSAMKYLVYVQAAIEHVTSIRPNLEGLSAAMGKVDLLLDAVPLEVREGFGRTVARPLTEILGHTETRQDRVGWKERLSARLDVPDAPRDSAMDAAVLHGSMDTPDVRAQLSKEVTRTVRFLVSSTFTDTTLERNLLLADVMPAVQEFARRLRIEAVMVEMRWGIRAEASQAHETSDICMREIERSISESIGFSYIFLGTQKYGFRPFPSKIPQEYFDLLVKFIPDQADVEILEDMFTLDHNACGIPSPSDDAEGEEEWRAPQEWLGPPGPVYVLRNRVEDTEWWHSFERLQVVLREAAKQVWAEEASGLRDPASRHYFKKFFISVTEEEMCRGMLWTSRTRQAGQTAAYMRTIGDPETWMKHPDADQFLDISHAGQVNEVDKEASAMVQELRGMIPSFVPQRHYGPLKWGPGLDPNQPSHKEYLRQFADDFTNDLLESVSNAARKAAVAPDTDVEEAHHHLRFALRRTRTMCETASTASSRARVDSFLSAPAGHAFVVFGSSGSGKTFLMSKVVVEAAAANVKAGSGWKGCVCARFLGTSAASSAVRPLLLSILRQLKRVYGKEEALPVEFVDIAILFRTAVTEWPSEAQPLTLLLDSLDQLDDTDAGRRLEWLPITNLPPYLRLVVSTLPDHADFNCLSRIHTVLRATEGGENALENHSGEVETISEPIKVLEHILALHGRKVTEEQMGAVTEALAAQADSKEGSSVLWLRIVAQKLIAWRSFDGVRHAVLASTVPEMIVDLLENTERKHGRFLVNACFAYITLTKGVAEGELLHLISLDDDTLADVYEWWVPPLRTAPPLLTARLLLDWHPYMTLRGDGSGAQLYSWYHRQFWEVLQSHLFGGVDAGSAVSSSQGTSVESFGAGAVRRRQRHLELADYFSGVWAGVAKPYTEWLSAVVQRPHFFPGEKAGDRCVPQQPLCLMGRVMGPASERVLNVRRINALLNHLMSAGDQERSVDELCSVDYIAAKMAMFGGSEQLLREFARAINKFPKSGKALSQVRAFVGRSLESLRAPASPTLPAQLVIQEPDHAEIRVRFKASESTRSAEETWDTMEWPRRPQMLHPCQLTIREHAMGIQGVAVSSDGTLIASAGDDKVIRLCNALTGFVSFSFAGHSSAVVCVAFAPHSDQDRRSTLPRKAATGEDGEGEEDEGTLPASKVLVSGDASGEIRLWNLVSGAEEKMVKGHDGRIRGIAFSPSGDTFASASQDKTAKIWDATTGKLVRTLTGHEGWVTCLAWCPTGKEIATASFDATVRLYDVQTGEGRVFGKCVSFLLCVAMSPDCTLIVAAGATQIRVWARSDGSKVAYLGIDGIAGGVRTVAFTPSGQTFASGGGGDCSVALWGLSDAGAWEEKRRFEGHGDWVNSLAFCPTSKTLITGSGDKSVRLWEVPEEPMAATVKPAGRLMRVDVIAMSRCENMLASGTADGNVRIWSGHTGAERATLLRDAFPVEALAFSPDCETLVAGCNDGSLHVWEAKTGVAKWNVSTSSRIFSLSCSSLDAIAAGCLDNTCRVYNAHSQELLASIPVEGFAVSVDFAPDGTEIAAGTGSGAVLLVPLETATPRLTLQGHSGTVWGVSWARQGGRVASVSQDSTCRIWDAASGAVLHTLTGWAGYLRSVRFDSTGEQIVVGGTDNCAAIFDVQTGTCSREFAGHAGWVTGAVFTESRDRIITGSHDDTLKIWDANSGREMQMLIGHTRRVTSIEISSIKLIAVGRADKTLQVWDMKTMSELFSVQAHADIVVAVAFSASSTIVASGSFQSVTTRCASSGTLFHSLQGHEGWVSSIRVVGGENGLVWARYQRPWGEEVAEEPPIFCWDTSTGERVAAEDWKEGPPEMEPIPALEDRTERHKITTNGQLLFVHALPSEEGRGGQDLGPAVSCFQAPAPISVLRYCEGMIACGLEDGQIVGCKAPMLV